MTPSNILFIAMDVHKESIVISLADDDRSEMRHYGSIGGTLDDFKKMLRKLVSTGKDLFFVMKPVSVAMSCIVISHPRGINASW